MNNNQIKIKLSELKSRVSKYNLSPEVRSLFDTLILFIEILLSKTNKNSKNSSIPPSQDQNREKKKSSTPKKVVAKKGMKALLLKLIQIRM